MPLLFYVNANTYSPKTNKYVFSYIYTYTGENWKYAFEIESKKFALKFSNIQTRKGEP